MSSSLAATISAAAEGVAARRSATMSDIVQSISWPTAEITGISLVRYGPRQRLVVKRPQVLGRTAAATDDQHVKPFRMPASALL